jgi:hypothetical protein
MPERVRGRENVKALEYGRRALDAVATTQQMIQCAQPVGAILSLALAAKRELDRCCDWLVDPEHGEIQDSRDLYTMSDLAERNRTRSEALARADASMTTVWEEYQ